MNQFSSASEHEEDDRSSENELRDDDSFLAVAVVAMASSRHYIRRDPQPMLNSRLTDNEFIRWPDYTEVQPLIEEHSYKYRPWFDNCIGIIDGTHVPFVPREDNSEAWVNRKGVHSQNVLAACSFNMKFTYMLAGYEGSCHDAIMLEEAIAFHGFPIPPHDGVPIGGHVDVNADVVLADGADDAGLSTGRQQDASTRGAMNQLREVLADEMWDRYQRFPWY
ncbi:hypothetical protein TIFTF001_016865 [Ficus carica]|uniref:DDE Tnp4 domain-containing protein n=1 Tax=Ficus carica TaxID=3494 RepID=A0AA88A9I6_FICCA|nr:hypothetical protein TIFTF001_016865 [Ficus carica]